MDASALRYWDLWLILLLLATVVPWRGYQRVKKLLALDVISSADRMTIYGSTILFQWLLAGGAFWRARAHDISLKQLGLAMPSPIPLAGLLAIAAALSLVLLAVQARSMRTLARLPVEKQGRMGGFLRQLMPPAAAGAAERTLFAGVALTAGICEEFLFRGFAITGLMLLVTTASSPVEGSIAFPEVSAWAAAVIASVIFGASHAYQGVAGALSTFVVGLVFSLVYLATGSLFPTVVAHAVVDFVGGIWTHRVLARGG